MTLANVKSEVVSSQIASSITKMRLASGLGETYEKNKIARAVVEAPPADTVCPLPEPKAKPVPVPYAQHTSDPSAEATWGMR